MIEDAISFAAQAHQGQTDQAGELHIFHPLRVMLSVKDAGGSETEIAAAALHDVVEYTDTTLDEIEQLFGKDVAFLVDAMSRRKGEDYVKYVERCAAAGTSAVKLKRADLTDNSNPERLSHMSPELRQELGSKYQSGFETLERCTRP